MLEPPSFNDDLYLGITQMACVSCPDCLLLYQMIHKGWLLLLPLPLPQNAPGILESMEELGLSVCDWPPAIGQVVRKCYYWKL